MKPTNAWTLLAAGGITLLAIFTFVRAVVRAGGSLMAVPWPIGLILLVLAVCMVVIGWPVREWNSERRSKPLDMGRAARTAAMAKAASLAGSVLAGGYAGYAVALFARGSDAHPGRAFEALVAAAGALLVVAAGLLVEKWCRVKPPEDEDAHER